MPITDPEAIRFVNEQVRPLAEEMRSLKARIRAMQTAWFAGLNQEFPNSADPVEDGRQAEGVSRLTGANVNSAVGIAIAVADSVNDEIVSLPCVRPLQAE